MLRTLILTASLGALSVGPAASALTAEQKVFKEVQTQSEDGTVKTSRVAAEMVIPGETVVYALMFENDKAQPAEGIVLTMPIPADIAYIDDSAETELASLVYSADNGDSFSERNSVMTIDNDGSLRVAKADELTHVRWTVKGAVPSGSTGELSFKGKLK